MIKKKVITILTTLSLLVAAAVINFLHQKRLLYSSPWIPITMLVFTAIYVFGSCMLQTLGHPSAALVLGVTVFFVLCTCLFYSVSILDFVTFMVSMSIVMVKYNKACGGMGKCDNPFRP